ncbi:DNA polymerase III subunit gamma/tau [Halomonas urumqiensis]|uniref:DNA polymerase III subunit gamma/tau n=1 Tax=Halomonas urumqiensis TaxID=1684789 RepID=A0A2N7UFA3_9GAMM|nr:DNA polymerase III subunit gamma/tau [Halomonas urumqiensis]PMR79149.1 DNA polymerase III subunit gamma/tau [Halomonas urumqiensis]PTB03824.1 DNA polymerase III subunit gamma/tau [Halomonas urumqiensis]GHE19942.1 DNA polymerase III subunit gamma/tau [Halomonas urumqiensis]
MSYQVLARKWRPRTFHELVGQEHVQRALVNALDQGRLHHAYLFTGTRGVGKTTLARILAKCLNCTAKGRGDEAVTSTPCGECDSCRAIDEGRFVDLIEVDAASRTKVEDTRELLDNVQYAPTQGRFKVYLIDEVHMLSTSSFNALLKTLEEPPPHVKFLLATTDPQKLPATVLSRCLQFTLKQMSPERIVGHLTKVLGAESVPFEESALWLLGRAAQGSMRDAMSLTDQAIAFGQGRVEHADVAAMLGTLDQRHVLALVEALADVDAARLLAEVAALAERAPDFAGVLDEVTALLHRLAIAQMVPDALDNGHGDLDALLALASRFTAEDIQLYYQIGIQGRGDMEHAPDLRTALEMTLLRMLAFRPQGVPRPAKTPLPLRGESPGVSNASAGRKPDAADEPQSPSADHREPMARALTSDEAPAPSASDATATPSDQERLRYHEPAAGAAARTESPAATPEAPPPAEQEPVDEPPPWIEAEAETHDAPATFEPEVVVPEVVASEETLPPPPGGPSLAPAAASPDPVQSASAAQDGFNHADWLACFESLGLGGLTRNLAASCIVEADDGARLQLRLDPALSAMRAEVHIERIQAALADHGVARRLVVEEGVLPEGIETPRQQAERLAAKRHAKAVEALKDDPHVQNLQSAFGARLIESTVKPASAEIRH